MSRRCLICANINPCSRHSEQDQVDELARNDREIARIKGEEFLNALKNPFKGKSPHG